MRKIRLTVSYDGTDFSGFQVQPNRRTVQGVLQDALAKLTKAPVRVVGAGRTDAGVHAYGQVVHFETDSRIPVDKWPLALNAVLPPDVVVRDAREVDPAFHARYSATGKTYVYRVDNRSVPDVLARRYAYHVPHALDVARMRAAARYLLGRHDFTSFCSAKTTVKGDRVRHLRRADIVVRGRDIWFCFAADGFLYNMVRILVGTLLEVGQGLRDPETMPDILAARDRAAAGKTAPPHGLILWSVAYGDDDAHESVDFAPIF